MNGGGMLEIGEQIKRLREQKQMTGKDLAQRIGLSQSQMSRLEQGKRRVDTEVLARIAEALEVPPATFFQGTTDRAEDERLTGRRERELSIARLHRQIGRRIRSERRRRHLTIDDLARKTGHTRAFVAAVEEGRRTGLEEDFLRKACRMLSIDPFSLFESQEEIIHELKLRIDRIDRELAAEKLKRTVQETEEGLAGTPILVGDESLYPSEFDDSGRPMAAVEGYLLLPELVGLQTFAVRVQGDEMEGPRSPSFAEGDIVVFDCERAAESGGFAFIRFGEDQTTFRRIFFDEGGVVRLQAVCDEVPPLLIPESSLTSAWPLVAHISHCE